MAYTYPKTYQNAYGRVVVYKNAPPSDPTRKPSYTITWQEARGKEHRHRKTRSDEKEAHLLAETILNDMTKGGEARPDITAAKMADFIKAQEILQEHGPAGLSMADAISEFVGLTRPVHMVSMGPKHMLGDIIPQYIETLVADKSAAHSITAKSILNSFLGDMRSDTPVSDITPLMIDEWLRKTENQNTRASRQRYLRAFFNWMRRKEFLPDTTTAAEKSETVPPMPKDPQTLSPEDLSTILEACLREGKKDAARYIAFGAFTGIRKSELLRLRWVNIRSGNVILESSITKTNRRRLVPIRPNLSYWIEATGGRGPFEVPICPVNDITVSIKNILDDTGIEWKDNCLRHGFITYSIAKGDPAHLIAEQAGHSQDEMQSSYKALATPEEGEAWFSIVPPKEFLPKLQNKNETPWQAGLPPR